MKVKILHFSNDDGSKELIAIVEEPAEFENDYYGDPDTKLISSTIADINLPPTFPTGEVWKKIV